MAYIEHDQLDAQLKKLENVCAENGFTYKFLRDKYPVRIIITPDGTMDGQMSMLDNPVGYNTKGSALAFVFVDGDVYLNPGKEGGLSLSKRLQNKLRTIAEKVYFNYLKVFFIDTLEAKKMADKEIFILKNAVHALKDPLEREVVRLRYMDGDHCRPTPWREVAWGMYQEADDAAVYRAKRIHDRAISHIAL